MPLRTFTVAIQKDGPGYGAWVEEVPGAFGQGKTVEEATKSAKEAIKLLLQIRAEEMAEPSQGPVIRKRVRVRF